MSVEYTDDGITLDYDRLKELFPNSLVQIKSKNLGHFKIEKGEFVYCDRVKRALRSLDLSENGHYLQGNGLELTGIKSEPGSQTLELANLEKISGKASKDKNGIQSQSLKINKQTKRAVKRGGRRGVGKTRGKKKTTRKTTGQVEETYEDDSTNESTIETIKTEGVSEIQAKKEESEVLQIEEESGPQTRSSRALEKEGTKVFKEKTKKRIEPLFNYSIDLDTPNTLTNRLPNFSDKYKFRNIHVINKSYYFDPLHPSL